MVMRYSGHSPFQDTVSLRDAMDRLFNESMVPSAARSTSSNSSEGTAPFPLDVYSDDNELTLLASLPGMDSGALDITIEKDQVILKGEIPNVASSQGGKDATWYLHELPRGKFQRTLTLPFEVDADNAQAIAEHGMLRLTLPKAETERPRQIKVRVAGGSPGVTDGDQES